MEKVKIIIDAKDQQKLIEVLDEIMDMQSMHLNPIKSGKAAKGLEVVELSC